MPRKNTTLASGDTAHLDAFAHGEDVGHGVDHDCPACRINRQALKRAGLHASDIQGLAGAAPSPEAGADPHLGNQPDKHIDEVAATVESNLSADPNDKPIEGAAPPKVGDQIEIVGDGSGRQLPPIDLEGGAGDGGETMTEEDADEARKFAERHRRLIALSSRLDDVLSKTMVPRGYSPNLIDGHDTDIAEAIIDNGGRFMLMAGFIPEDRDWHCEIGIGSERSHVQHPNQGIAIRLAMLLALDPKAGSPLNSAFMQLVEESKPRAVTRHWVGTGVQP